MSAPPLSLPVFSVTLYSELSMVGKSLSKSAPNSILPTLKYNPQGCSGSITAIIIIICGKYRNFSHEHNLVNVCNCHEFSCSAWRTARVHQLLINTFILVLSLSILWLSVFTNFKENGSTLEDHLWRLHSAILLRHFIPCLVFFRLTTTTKNTKNKYIL